MNKNPWGDPESKDAQSPAEAPKTFRGRTVLQPKPKQAVSARGGRTEARPAATSRGGAVRPQASPSPGVKQGQEVHELRRRIAANEQFGAELLQRVEFLERLTKPEGPPDVEDDPAKRSDG
jgi:hypothetical protein